MARILLVEDDADVADMLCEVLETLGHSVRHARNATAALGVIDAGPLPDLVISDMMMPGKLSGLELAEELHRRAPKLPVVLATGYTERASDFRAAGLPVLNKPFRTGELEETIRAALASAA